MKRVISESKSFRGSNVYLTGIEKEALKRAIDQYYTNVEGTEDKRFIEFFKKYDQEALTSAYDKLAADKYKRRK